MAGAGLGTKPRWQREPAADVLVNDLVGPGWPMRPPPGRRDLARRQAEARRLKIAVQTAAEAAELIAAAARHGDLQGALEVLDEAVAATDSAPPSRPKNASRGARQAAEA